MQKQASYNGNYWDIHQVIKPNNIQKFILLRRKLEEDLYDFALINYDEFQISTEKNILIIR